MATALRPYRHIEFLHGACPACDGVFALTEHHDQPSYVNRYGIRQKAYLLKVHGPRDNRCPGSHQTPAPWLEASGLPCWDDLSDLDKGAALMHVWKRKREGGVYARENYPVRYISSEVLRSLDVEKACRHAVVVTDGWTEANNRFGADEVARLYDLALDYERSAR